MKWIKWIISILLLIIILFGINYLINKIDEKDIFEYIKKDIKADFPNKFKQYDIQKCSFWFWNREYAFIGNYNDDFDSKKIFFYEIKNENGKISENYIGGTTVKNTNFQTLLKMVKDDCYQFQKAKGEINDKVINWSYSSYNPEPEKTEEEKKQREEELKEYYRKIESGEIEAPKPLEGFVEYNEDGTIK